MEFVHSNEVGLRNSPSTHARKEIVHRLWRRKKDDIDLEDYVSYFDHYAKTCRSLYVGARCEADYILISDHEHILLIIDRIWSYIDQGMSVERPFLRESLAKTHFRNQADERINITIDLALRLWLTMNIKQRGVTPVVRDNPWNDKSDLSAFVRAQFPGPKVGHDINAPLVGALTAVDLERTSGIHINWTYHLEDHLLFDRIKRKLNVYCLDRVLQDQMMRFVFAPA